jgi:hypothetical protein
VPRVLLAEKEYKAYGVKAKGHNGLEAKELHELYRLYKHFLLIYFYLKEIYLTFASQFI